MRPDAPLPQLLLPKPPPPPEFSCALPVIPRPPPPPFPPSNELFVLFLLQTKALDILEIPGFHRHIPSDLNNFSLEAKEDFFKFSNQLFKETDSGFYADWQVFTDGMYWDIGIEVNPNNEGDFPIVDFNQTATEEDE